MACIQAWNDWLFEEWHEPYPERIVPLGITYLADPELAVAEIRRNAERGFTAMTFPERPHMIGLPSLWDRDHWDPIMQAMRRHRHGDLPARRQLGPEPGTAGRTARCSSAPRSSASVSLTACAEWLWSGYAAAHPEAEDRHERGRHRLGRDAARPARQHRRSVGLRPRLGRAPGRRPASATSGSARSTTRRPSTPATASASRTSWWRPTTRTATAPGPTPSSCSRRRGATSRPRSCARCAARTPPASSATRCPPTVLPRD